MHNFDYLVVVSLQSNFVEKQAEGFVASVPSSLGKRAHVCGKRAKFLGASMPQVLWQACQVFWARMSSFGWQACQGIFGASRPCIYII